MKVLVTGATGFIGKHVVSELLGRDHEVTVLGRDIHMTQDLDWLDEVRFIVCDIYGDMSRHPEIPLGTQAVMHLAWPGLPNYGSPIHYSEALPAASRFLNSLVDAGIGHLLVTGTCFEYGMKSGPMLESTPTEPANPYALAKDALRKYLELLQQRKTFILQWARLFYMFGPGQHPGSLFAQLDRAIDSGSDVFNMSLGDQLRDYLPVEVVADRLVSLLETPACVGCVNICNGTPVSIRQLVENQIARRGARIRLNLGYYPYSEFEPFAFWGDNQKYLSYCHDS